MIEENQNTSPLESPPETIRLGKFRLDCLDVDQIMERLTEFVRNDHLNTFAFISRRSLIEAQEDSRLADYLMRLDACAFSEKEVLEAAGIRTGRVYEEVAGHGYLDRIFWQIVKADLGVYLLCEDETFCSRLNRYLSETFPGIRIAGANGRTAGNDIDSDHILNQINSENPDIIITGLGGKQQNLFMLQNQAKVFGKIWMNLGESPHLLEGIGMKPNWLTRRRIKRYFCDIFVENE